MNNAIGLPEAKLDPTLADTLTQSDGGYRMLQHKFCHTLYAPEMNSLYNLQLLNKTEAVRRALDERNDAQFVFLHERPYRLDALLELLTHCDADEGDAVLKELLVDVYIDAEGLHYNSPVWRVLFDRLPADERQRELLPDTDTFCIYRGVGDYRHKDGFSWTLDRLTATFFAQRFDSTGKGGHVFVRQVTRADVAYYTDGRGESECLYWPAAKV